MSFLAFSIAEDSKQASDNHSSDEANRRPTDKRITRREGFTEYIGGGGCTSGRAGHMGYFSMWGFSCHQNRHGAKIARKDRKHRSGAAQSGDVIQFGAAQHGTGEGWNNGASSEKMAFENSSSTWRESDQHPPPGGNQSSASPRKSQRSAPSGGSQVSASPRGSP